MINKINIRDYHKFLNYPHKPLTNEELDACEDIFAAFLDNHFDYEFFDNELTDDYIQLQNFFPYFYGKDVGDGAWVRVKTDIGYNVYYAKKSRKYFSHERLDREYKKLQNKVNPSIKDIDRKLEILKEKQVAYGISTLATELQYIKIRKSKSKWEYLLPYQYEIIDDIQLYVDAVLDPQVKHSVKYKEIFTKEDYNQIFYIQSRGISKTLAILLSKLEQCFFIVDTNAIFSEVFQLI